MSEFSDFIVDNLQEVGIIESKRMFGGYGLYLEDIFFGIIADDRLYFKVDERTKKQYLDAGMEAFNPFGKKVMKTYYEVPVSVLEDSELLCEWASEAISAQLGRIDD